MRTLLLLCFGLAPLLAGCAPDHGPPGYARGPGVGGSRMARPPAPALWVPYGRRDTGESHPGN